ncbi:holin [Streptomyces halstedii]|uniref:Holin n=1 Tax=Streptomyces halstedii TaxID=1944 RepID=A0ABS6TTJ7_STRHA|nr:holin [Streptomyces halstedii]MBV7671364.1 holin [Streptomyces halstedii]
MAAPVEKKVTAASAGAYLASTGLLASLAAVQDNARLVEWMPDGLAPFVLALVPAAVTFVGGWAARHTPRSRYGDIE